MNRADESPYLLAREGGLALDPLWARVATSAGGVAHHRLSVAIAVLPNNRSSDVIHTTQGEIQ